MTTKALYREIVESTFSIPVRVTDGDANFWPVIGLSLGLVEPELTDFVTTMSAT